MYLNVKKKLNDAYLSCHLKVWYHMHYGYILYIYVHVLQDSRSLSKHWTMYHNFIMHYFHVLDQQKNMSAASLQLSFTQGSWTHSDKRKLMNDRWRKPNASVRWNEKRRRNASRSRFFHDQKTIIHIIHIWYISSISPKYGIVTWNFWMPAMIIFGTKCR